MLEKDQQVEIMECSRKFELERSQDHIYIYISLSRDNGGSQQLRKQKVKAYRDYGTNILQIAQIASEDLKK